MEGTTCSIVVNSKAVFKDMYFPASRAGHVGKKTVCDDLFCLSEVFAVQSEGTGDGGNIFVCVHEKPLKLEYCNTWASKVSQMHHMVYKNISWNLCALGLHSTPFKCVIGKYLMLLGIEV